MYTSHVYKYISQSMCFTLTKHSNLARDSLKVSYVRGWGSTCMHFTGGVGYLWERVISYFRLYRIGNVAFAVWQTVESIDGEKELTCHPTHDAINVIASFQRTFNCPHNETKLKQNSLETVSKYFCFSFVSLCGEFYRYTRISRITDAAKNSPNAEFRAFFTLLFIYFSGES